MSETEKKPAARTPRKKAAPVEAPSTEWVEENVPVQSEKPILAASGLVAYNEVARNSRSVRAVQDELIERGHWAVRADDAGYWGSYTQDAALTETDETDPVKAAEALGFTVLP